MERITDNTEIDGARRKDIITSLLLEYPFLKRQVIGKSCVGRDIYALKLGNGGSLSVFVGATHGSEHITENILFYFLEELCFTLKHNKYLAGLNTRRALYGKGICIIPCLNPDGCEISIHGEIGGGTHSEDILKMSHGNTKTWNANARGVDLNHNFDAKWEEVKKKEREMGIFAPSSTRFGGFKPFSEPETVAIMDFCNSLSLHHLTALHTQGEVIYYSFEGKEGEKGLKMAQIMASTSGYALDVPIGIAYGGGLKDWFIDKFSRPAFTLEMGLGKNPLPQESAFFIYEKAREMLTLNAIM